MVSKSTISGLVQRNLFQRSTKGQKNTQEHNGTEPFFSAFLSMFPILSLEHLPLLDCFSEVS